MKLFQSISKLFATAIFFGPGLANAQINEYPVISFDAKAVDGTVNPLLFGVNHRWVSNACGSADSITGITYPGVVNQIKDIGISMIRYPAGTLGNLFKWELAIGPQEKRGLQVGGLLTMPVPYKSTFGPDEYGNLLEQTGAKGNLMINCATATAADAANFVAYMTAPIGSPPVNGVDWAAKRASNGHPAPYKVEYVEIGNEYEPAIQPLIDQNYWIKGEPVGFTPVSEAEKISRLYAFGGSTKFTNQPVVQQADWQAPTSISNGTPGQTFYVRYAPVTAGSATVFVDGKTWKAIADLSKANADAAVYLIEEKSGLISFGDGRHGAIPGKGSRVTVTFISGHHEGFVDFYRAIKAANPAIKVCSSIHDEIFLKMMGTKYPYDGIQQHPYVISDPKKTKAFDLADFFIQSVIATTKLGNEVEHVQHLIQQNAGPAAGNIHLLLSEYGQLGIFPSYAPHFARSQGQAILQAVCMREWVLHHVQAADRTVLTDYTFQPIPPDLAAVQFSDAASAGDFAVIGGPGPSTIVTPVGWAMMLLKEAAGQSLITCTVNKNPEITSSAGDKLDALLTFATIDKSGNAFLAVINGDPRNDIRATIAPTNFVFDTKVQVSLLASPGINDENNPENSARVKIKASDENTGGRNFQITFPKYSVTTIKLKRQFQL